MPTTPTCPTCKKTLYVRNRKWVCEDHDEVSYNTTLEDRLHHVERFLSWNTGFDPLPEGKQ